MIRDIIQIIITPRALEPKQLRAIVDLLESDGHHCSTSKRLDGIQAALHDQRSKLLLLGATGGELPALVKILRAGRRDIPAVPHLVYLKQVSPDNPELLVANFDDFMFEPLNLNDLRLRVHRLVRQFAVALDQLETARQEVDSHFGMRKFIGKAPSFLAVIEKILRLASCAATVLITGETGTGKEMCARAMHYLSARAGGPFIPVNCSALPDHLFENELFGHVKGAFTDASSTEKGLVAEAEGGTLVLDEVDSLSPSAQAKLLRFLQNGEYRPLGSSKSMRAYVRIIAASNIDLTKQVEQKLFREDLYYRLNVLSLSIPPLRERISDIPHLASHFLRQYASQYGRKLPALSAGTMQKLMDYGWPGNVRELEGVIHRAVVLSASSMIHPQDIDIPSRFQREADETSSLREAKSRAITQFERAYLTNLLTAHRGNITRAAQAAGKERRAFQRLVRKYGLERHAFRSVT